MIPIRRNAVAARATNAHFKGVKRVRPFTGAAASADRLINHVREFASPLPWPIGRRWRGADRYRRRSRTIPIRQRPLSWSLAYVAAAPCLVGRVVAGSKLKLRSVTEVPVDYRQIITIEPGKRSGKPCIRGLRITVYDVLGYLASGMTEDEILRDFPYLTRDDIRACLAYAAEREQAKLVATS